MTYGEHYITYGVSRRCARCGMIHGSSGAIRESAQSRFKLMQLLAEIVINKYFGFSSVDQDPRMLGILITPLCTYAAQSGNWLNGNTPFLQSASGKGYQICKPRTANDTEKAGKTSKTTNIDAAGRPIPVAMYKGTNRTNQGGYAPGNCAAPRLIQQAIEDHLALGVRIRPARWSMSEVMYKQNPTEVPTNANRQEWVHGLTAFSCETCAHLVPVLLCNDQDWSEDNMLEFKIRR